MRTLHLNLKKKWFDMILSGEKKEEYREFKPFWISRLIDVNAPEERKGENKYIPLDIAYDVLNGHKVEDVLSAYYSTYKTFDVVTFKNGYSKNAREMTVEFLGTEIGKAKPEWSDNWQRDVFVIKLGKIISVK